MGSFAWSVVDATARAVVSDVGGRRPWDHGHSVLRLRMQESVQEMQPLSRQVVRVVSAPVPPPPPVQATFRLTWVRKPTGGPVGFLLQVP